ncbi:MAG: hypothetical protein LAT61_00365 [Alcanivorax sp.]|nr:hypothetical protein [Alcanivorax sp.]
MNKNIKTKFIIMLAALSLAITSLAQALNLEPLDDDDMAGISGREGVGVNFSFLINAELASDGQITPIACPGVGTHSNGTPDCRLALQFNDMSDEAGLKAWLVLKDYHGAFSINGVRFDSVRTSATPSSLCDAQCAARFPAGFSPDDKPALQLSYDHSDMQPGAAHYGDVLFYFSAARITAEFGDTGYLLDNTSGSALGIRMADGPNAINGAAQMRFDGQLQMYGY